MKLDLNGLDQVLAEYETELHEVRTRLKKLAGLGQQLGSRRNGKSDAAAAAVVAQAQAQRAAAGDVPPPVDPRALKTFRRVLPLMGDAPIKGAALSLKLHKTSKTAAFGPLKRLIALGLVSYDPVASTYQRAPGALGWLDHAARDRVVTAGPPPATKAPAALPGAAQRVLAVMPVGDALTVKDIAARAKYAVDVTAYSGLHQLKEAGLVRHLKRDRKWQRIA